MTTLNEISEAQYIALETFRKNGTGVVTPVWQTPEDGKLYVWTEANSWKVKRIRNNGRVRVAASDARGTPESDWVEAQAKVLNSEGDFRAQNGRMAAKYGLFFRFFQLVYKLRGRESVVVEISA
ncbi:MAG: PPOX class F420-dependent oxidoreductase [Chloroflexota bacterium]